MRRVPEFKTDAEPEAFLEQDLSNLDFKQFKPMCFGLVSGSGKSLRISTPRRSKAFDPLLSYVFRLSTTALQRLLPVRVRAVSSRRLFGSGHPGSHSLAASTTGFIRTANIRIVMRRDAILNVRCQRFRTGALDPLRALILGLQTSVLQRANSVALGGLTLSAAKPTFKPATGASKRVGGGRDHDDDIVEETLDGSLSIVPRCVYLPGERKDMAVKQDLAQPSLCVDSRLDLAECIGHQRLGGAMREASLDASIPSADSDLIKTQLSTSTDHLPWFIR